MPAPYVECAVCKKKLRYVNRSHLAMHGLTTETYANLYPNAEFICEATRVLMSESAPATKSEEHANKISAALLGVPKSIEAVENMRKSITGRKLSEAHKRILSISGKNRVLTEAQLSRMRLRKGKHHTNEAKAKIRKARLAYIRSGKGWHSSIEKWFKLLLEVLGIEFIHQGRIPGFPAPYSLHPFDFTIPSMRLAIEVDGCYYHGCPDCYPECGRLKKDIEIDKLITVTGWSIKRIWEHDIYVMRSDSSELFQEICALGR